MLAALVPLSAAFCLSCSAGAPSDIARVELVEAWRLDGFSSPESVLLDPATGLLFVSNVNGEGGFRDGNGFISRITLDGEIETLEWATGLDAPKGMALVGDRLYVTDIAQIVCIDRTTGEITDRWPAPGAGFLNDAVAGPDGRVYVSDSRTARIYVLEDGMVHVWAEHDTLSAINGLWIEEDRMLTVTMEGVFASLSLSDQSLTPLGTGLGSADALVSDGQGAYLASEWPGQIYHLRGDGSFDVLADTRDQDIYMNDFIRVDDMLIVPHWSPGAVSAWQIRYHH
ncbi:SMP-30/gluconolactonase/LRE family protein [Hyphobacterium sp.]|uniref:SMP-30/gluconolactonase/LRE family protein n=1 Tax=Hyphobacterium sp. TaxID=2004662 RepID=UPI003BAC08B2